LSSVEEKKSKAKPFEILLDEQQIARRIEEMGRDITTNYAGQKLILIGMLKGCMVFMADLMRHISLLTEVQLISARDIRAEDRKAEDLRFIGNEHPDLSGAHILIVEGVVDTGRTAALIADKVAGFRPASVEIATLLDKPASHRVKLDVKYKGFSIGNDFVIGFGLDNDGIYRNLPYVGRMIDE
jgi:hypoxanthine phosphoribosyltransferase